MTSSSLWNMTHRSRVTTFIGAGGKTTCLRSLTQEIESAGQQVVATTTTKVYPEEGMIPWRAPNPPSPNKDAACFWYDRLEAESGKWIGPSVNSVDNAIAEEHCHSKRYWVIEGDGARGLKLKCWESYEPQIPKYTDCAVLVVDRGLWGKVLQAEQVHRSYLCKDLLGTVWNAENAWSYFLRSPVFAPQYAPMSWVILLNSPEITITNKGVIASRKPLDVINELKARWLELQQNSVIEMRPCHLRLAVGDAKEGNLRWFDLW